MDLKNLRTMQHTSHAKLVGCIKHYYTADRQLWRKSAVHKTLYLMTHHLQHNQIKKPSQSYIRIYLLHLSSSRLHKNRTLDCRCLQCLKKGFLTFLTLEQVLSNFHNFRQQYTQVNSASNDGFISHLAQLMRLPYLGNQQTKIASVIQHSITGLLTRVKRRYVHNQVHLFFQFIQLPTTNVQNAGPLRKHMRTDPLVDSRVDITSMQTIPDLHFPTGPISTM